MKRILFWVGVLISVALLVVALRGLKLDEFVRDLGEANLLWLVPGIALYFVSVWFRSWRWSLLLRPLGVSVPARRLFPVVVIKISASLTTVSRRTTLKPSIAACKAQMGSTSVT